MWCNVVQAEEASEIFIIVFSFSNFLSNSVESRSRSLPIKCSCAIFRLDCYGFIQFFSVAILANVAVLTAMILPLKVSEQEMSPDSKFASVHHLIHRPSTNFLFSLIREHLINSQFFSKRNAFRNGEGGSASFG